MSTISEQPSEKVTLSCRDLAVGYKNQSILSGVDLDFEQGSFISLLGPNGAGKTTLLRTLSRHLNKLSGAIMLDGRPLESFRPGELAKLMAVVLTDKVTPPLFTSFQFAALGRYPHTGFLGKLTSRDIAVVQRALASVCAEDLAERDFNDLSDGERQKILVARALAQEPRVLLLDEPTAHLDLKHRVEVMSILRNLCAVEGITVIASLHDIDIAAKVSDKVALIKDGGIQAWGPPEEVLDSQAVSRLYDFESASFNSRLGSIELRGTPRNGRAFVIGGMGRGTSVFRVLAKCGYSISTGVLYDNDLDCYVARSLGANCSSQYPSNGIDRGVLDSALREMERCDWVIDAGLESGVYGDNRELLEKACLSGKPVFRVGGQGEGTQVVAGLDSIVQIDRASDLPQALRG